MGIGLPIIETPRLILREVKVSDCHDMYEYAKLPFVGPTAGWEPHHSVNETKTILQLFVDKKKYGQLGVFAVIYKETNKMIGTIELHTYVKGFKAELGYTINPLYWGMGLAVEASVEVMKWGFNELQLKRLECTTFTTNTRSKRVCEKLHFTYEGIRKNGYMLYDGSFHDLYAYALTDYEFYERYYNNKEIK